MPDHSTNMSQSLDKFLKVLALCVILVIGLAGVVAARGLYADGSFWLFEMLSRNGFYIFDQHRAYSQFLVQFPVALSIWLGVEELSQLIRIHSFGFIFIPLFFWIGALALQFKERLFWFFLLGFCVTYLRSNFFSAGEFSTTYGMVALCASILMTQKINLVLVILLILTSVLLTHSYEMTLLLSGLLVIVAAIRLFAFNSDARLVRLGIFTAILFLLMSMYVAGRSIFFQRSFDGRSTANFSALMETHFIYLVAIPIICFLLILISGRKARLTLFSLGIVIIFAYTLYVLRWDKSNISFGYLSYAYRALCGLLLAGVISASVVIFYYQRVFFSKPVHQASSLALGLLSITFLVSMAWPMLTSTNEFYQWLKRFEVAASTITTNTPIDHTNINKNHGWTHGPNWMWGNSYTSALLRGSGAALILNNSQCECADAQEKSLINGPFIQRGGSFKTQTTGNPLSNFQKSVPLF
jgi:hypothetical protein